MNLDAKGRGEGVGEGRVAAVWEVMGGKPL